MTNNVVKLQANGQSFEEWWSLCPKRVHKVLARVKWERITSNEGLETCTYDRDSNRYVAITLQATPEELIEAMKRYRVSQIDKQTYKLKDEGRYTLHPATWLNQGRWEDE